MTRNTGRWLGDMEDLKVAVLCLMPFGFVVLVGLCFSVQGSPNSYSSTGVFPLRPKTLKALSPYARPECAAA